MIEIETNVKEWGNSMGIILPKDIANKEKIKPGDKIKILIIKNNNILQETFGSLRGKMKRSSQKIKDDSRKEWSKY